MRVFKNKWFNRWARGEGISDAVLFNAAAEIATGKIEADLGGCLYKNDCREQEGERADDKQVQELLTVGSIWEVLS
jgi:hypothetical protein